MKRLSQCLCVAALAVFSAPVSAQDGVAAPDGSQTVTLTLLHEKDKPTWTDIEIARGAPLLRVMVNGQIVCGLIDTGSSHTAVDNDFAKTQGLKVFANNRLAKATSGTIQTFRVAGVPVELPGQFRFQADLIGIELPDYDCPGGGKLTFVLGLDILKFLTMGIDAPRKKVIFLRSGSINLRGDNWARFDWIEGQVVGKISGQPARLRIDTGSSSLLLVPANRFDTFFAGTTLETLDASTDAAGRKESNVGIRNVPVSLGDLTISSEAKRVAADDRPHDANLGFPFFIWTFTIFDSGQNLIAMRLPELKK